MNKPFSQSCINNQEPIREILAPYIKNGGRLLEIGSGTGQHGAYISRYYPDLEWQTSDRAENLTGIQAWVSEEQRNNFKSPLEIDINQAEGLDTKFDFIYSANTVHIMSWPEVQKLFSFIGEHLKQNTYFFLYGPFNYNGKFTSESNARFNEWLKQQASHRAIRDFEAINELATQHRLILQADKGMPANNRLLIWQYQS